MLRRGAIWLLTTVTATVTFQANAQINEGTKKELLNAPAVIVTQFSNDGEVVLEDGPLFGAINFDGKIYATKLPLRLPNVSPRQATLVVSGKGRAEILPANARARLIGFISSGSTLLDRLVEVEIGLNALQYVEAYTPVMCGKTPKAAYLKPSTDSKCRDGSDGKALSPVDLSKSDWKITAPN